MYRDASNRAGLASCGNQAREEQMKETVIAHELTRETLQRSIQPRTDTCMRPDREGLAAGRRIRHIGKPEKKGPIETDTDTEKHSTLSRERLARVRDREPRDSGSCAASGGVLSAPLPRTESEAKGSTRQTTAPGALATWVRREGNRGPGWEGGSKSNSMCR